MAAQGHQAALQRQAQLVNVDGLGLQAGPAQADGAFQEPGATKANGLKPLPIGLEVEATQSQATTLTIRQLHRTQPSRA